MISAMLQEMLSSFRRGFRPGSPLFSISIAICFTALLILVSYFFAQRKVIGELPQEFLDARREASATSREIVSLTDSVNKAVRSLNLLDVAEQKPEALNIVHKARTDVATAASRARELSRSLQRMTLALSSLSSGSAQQLAYAAITTEISLISEFFAYTDYLNSFLASIERSFARGSTREEQGAIGKALREANESAETINRLNNEFLAKMRLFDTSL